MKVSSKDCMLLELIFGRFSLTVLVALKTGFAAKTRNLSIKPSSPLSDINSEMKGCGCIRTHVDKEVRSNPRVPVDRTLWSPLPPHSLHSNDLSASPLDCL